MSQDLTLPGVIHLVAIVPAVVIAAVQFTSRKGTQSHKVLGWIWVLSMTVVAVSSFWIMELRKGAGFSVIHLLSLWVLICLVCAIWFIRRGNVRAHKRFMIGVTLGVIGAGIGALMPGRFLAQLLF
jgi:uncharacterized membrane protein